MRVGCFVGGECVAGVCPYQGPQPPDDCPAKQQINDQYCIDAFVLSAAGDSKRNHVKECGNNEKYRGVHRDNFRLVVMEKRFLHNTLAPFHHADNVGFAF